MTNELTIISAKTMVDDDGTCLECYGVTVMTFFARTVCDACLGIPLTLRQPRSEMSPQKRNARDGAARARRKAAGDRFQPNDHEDGDEKE